MQLLSIAENGKKKTFGTQQLSQAGAISLQNAVNSQLETRVCQTQQTLDL